MKGRESGMPEEAHWMSFFDADAAMDRLLGAGHIRGDVLEFGCGYGTFTLPAARRVTGVVTALDIEPDMVAEVRHKAAQAGLVNIQAELRDFVRDGTGVERHSQAHAMIFNLLHLEQPVSLLHEAHRILRDDGVVSVMHWRSDIPTPRGPSLEIRPTPDQCRAWLQDAGFHAVESVELQHCCPYHFGLLAYKRPLTPRSHR